MAKVEVLASKTEVTQQSPLPLALTAFEKFLFWDDKPEQPSTPFYELQFRNHLDAAILEESLAEVIARHPLLNALVAGDGGDLKWVQYKQPFRLLNPNQHPVIQDGKVRPIDLRKEPGVRIWYDAQGQSSRVLLQGHHCACDGIAMRSVLIDVLHSYAIATGEASSESRDHSMVYDRFRQSELHRRSDFGHLGEPKRALTTWQRIKNAHYFHFQPPKALLGVGKPGERSQGDDEPLRHLSLDRTRSQLILEKCKEQSLGVNELSIALLFRACCAWNREHGDKNSSSRLRVLMPYDLRGRSDLQMPATNRLSFTFLGRNYQQCDDFSGLLESVQEELTDMEETHLYLDFLNALTLACKSPRLMRWVLDRSNSMATAVITYAGDISRGMSKLFPEVDGARQVGGALLHSIMAAPPVRRNTNISLALCINWGQINISAAWNREVWSANDCEKFLELYKAGWQHWSEQ